jgi:hypothetical protein
MPADAIAQEALLAQAVTRLQEMLTPVLVLPGAAGLYLFR